MLQTENLSFRYHKKDPLFQFPDISLKMGENLLILGASGIGKTTLLHLLAGLLFPLHGRIEIGGTAYHLLSTREMDKFRGQNIGLVFQNNHAIQSLNVIENLKARLFFSKKDISHKLITDMLEQLDILDCKTKMVCELSQGQLQRLGIAMALIHQPQIILADEPTSSLDNINCDKVMQLLIQKAKASGANLVVITHDQRIKSLFDNKLEL